ncbi:hypothetical protein, partial [Micromonospora profundi]|uniref:hypothetical protein n=1 Tax=Micromonospora profundi TaxID=1420889 RepID=UPI0036589235
NSTHDHAKPSTGRIQPKYSTNTWLQPPLETAALGCRDFKEGELITRVDARNATFQPGISRDGRVVVTGACAVVGAVSIGRLPEVDRPPARGRSGVCRRSIGRLPQALAEPFVP